MKDELELISSKEFQEYDDMYKVIDFLNKNLENSGFVFGLCQKENKHVIKIYKQN